VNEAIFQSPWTKNEQIPYLLGQ